MFTGIITHIGKLNSKQDSIFIFNTDYSFCKKLKLGTSVAVDGVCLTIGSKPSNDSFSVQIMPETQRRTMLGKLKPDDLVNLELPTTVDAFLSGHLVQGHVDGVAEIINIKKEANSRIFRFKLPEKLTRYIANKGSISVNGVSLTVIEAGKNWFSVGVTPYTWRHTTLHQAKEKDTVNIELDIVAKYLEKLSKQNG